MLDLSLILRNLVISVLAQPEVGPSLCAPTATYTVFPVFPVICVASSFLQRLSSRPFNAAFSNITESLPICFSSLSFTILSNRCDKHQHAHPCAFFFIPFVLFPLPGPFFVPARFCLACRSSPPSFSSSFSTIYLTEPKTIDSAMTSTIWNERTADAREEGRGF